MRFKGTGARCACQIPHCFLLIVSGETKKAQRAERTLGFSSFAGLSASQSWLRR